MKGAGAISKTLETRTPVSEAQDLVCFSHLRWDFVFQRPHHLMSRAARDWRVFYVEEPRLIDDASHLQIQPDRSGVQVVIPHLEAGLDKAASRMAHVALVDQFFAEQQIVSPVLWYYTPMAVDYTRHLQGALVVYDCMDELSAFNGAPVKMKELESELLQRASLVFTGGQSLYEAKQQLHPRVYAFPSSIDREHFACARQAQADPLDQAVIPHPRIGFFGVIDERMDLGLIDALAGYRPDWHIVLIGPVAKLEPEDLPRRVNIHYLGRKDYRELPAYLAGWDAAVIPFAQNQATRFISPTKTPEYLAGGVPVVSTPIRDVVRPYGDQGLVWIAHTASQFIRALQSALEMDGSKDGWLERVDRFLLQSSWDHTWQAMTGILSDALDGILSDAVEGALPDELSTRLEAGPDGPAAQTTAPDGGDALTTTPVPRSVDLSLPEPPFGDESLALLPGQASARVRRKSPAVMFDYLIVGAGFAGSVLAERLARGSGKKVLLIDRRAHIGGNAYDHYDPAGLLVHKYGPHIFHTNSREVFTYLSHFTEWRPYEHRVRASVDGQLVPIPINLDTINRLYGLNLSAGDLEEFFAARAEAVEQVRTSEDVVVSRIGRELYEKFFRSYTRKQWGLDPSELDASVTSRVPVRSNRDDRYFSDTYQCMPLYGYTRMFENILDHPNIKIMLNTDYREITGFAPYREMIYTGPVDEYFDFCFGKLPYRSLEFKFVTLDEEQHQPVAVVNFPNEHPYTRVTEFKHLTGQVHPRTSLVYEFPCSSGDPYYPIPRPENADLYRRYKELADQTAGVHFAGRLGTYRYYNMDQVTAQALTLYARITGTARAEAVQAFTHHSYPLELPCSLLAQGIE